MTLRGVFPASVTPFDAQGRVDAAQMARLLAHFEAAGCAGAVLAGTNGEGPSLSAPEKRDLLRDAAKAKGSLKLILGIATPSLDEAIWLSKQAGEFGAEATLLMPPGYFRRAEEEGIRQWLEAVLDRSPVPVLLYNFPKMSGVALSSRLVAGLAGHPNLAGLKDSSGERANLGDYRQALPGDKALLVGDETLLVEALRAGWTGSISGAANVVPAWLSHIVSMPLDDPSDSIDAKFSLVLPVLEALRQVPQPEANKAILRAFGVLENENPRLPLLPLDPEVVQPVIDAVRALE